MRLSSALTLAFLASLTSGCASTDRPAPTIVTKYQQVYLPERFFQPCPKTPWPGGTYRQLAGVTISRGTDLDNCNAQLAAAKGYQDDLKAQEASQK